MEDFKIAPEQIDSSFVMSTNFNDERDNAEWIIGYFRSFFSKVNIHIVLGLIVSVTILLFGVCANEINSLFRWLTLFILPIWHIRSCIALIIGNRRGSGRIVYLIMNIFASCATLCLGALFWSISLSPNSTGRFACFAGIQLLLFVCINFAIVYVCFIEAKEDSCLRR